MIVGEQQAQLFQKQVTTATLQLLHNKALHPTSYSLRFARSSLRSGFRRRVSLIVRYLSVSFVDIPILIF